MSYYESIFVARQDVSVSHVKDLGNIFKAIVEENAGAVPKVEYCGLKNLTYRVKKNRKGHYMLLNIDAAPEAIQELERRMRLNEDIIRFLTVKVDALDSNNPSALARVHFSGTHMREKDDAFVPPQLNLPFAGEGEEPGRAVGPQNIDESIVLEGDK